MMTGAPTVLTRCMKSWRRKTTRSREGMAAALSPQKQTNTLLEKLFRAGYQKCSECAQPYQIAGIDSSVPYNLPHDILFSRDTHSSSTITQGCLLSSHPCPPPHAPVRPRNRHSPLHPPLPYPPLPPRPRFPKTPLNTTLPDRSQGPVRPYLISRSRDLRCSAPRNRNRATLGSESPNSSQFPETAYPVPPLPWGHRG